MVGDGDAVGIAAEILQDVLGSAEGWFGVDDPIFAEERTQPGSEELGMGERCEFSGQVQLTAFEGRLQVGDKLAAKHAPQYSNGKEEAWVGSNPAGVIEREPTSCDDAMDMGMNLIAASGGKWIFIGMESIDPNNLKDVNKGFNKPGEYAAVLERLAQRNVYAITSGVAERTLAQVRTWPPGLPIFGLLTPLPATPLYKRLETSGRLTRPKHWQEFIPFAMAHTPLKITIEQAHAEVKCGWEQAYSPEALAQAVDSLNDQPLGYRINIFLARLCFRGIYLPMMGKVAWLTVVAQNRHTIFELAKEAFFGRRTLPANPVAQDGYGAVAAPDVPDKASV
jgi:hypothetical protein